MNIYRFSFYYLQLKKDRPNSQPYDTKPGEKPYKLEIVWRNVLAFIYLHGSALYAIYAYTPKTSTLVIGESNKQTNFGCVTINSGVLY